MRCPVPLLAAWCWVALPHAVHAQPAPTQPRSPASEAQTPTETVPPQAGETKGQLPISAPAAPAALERGSDDTVTVEPGDEVLEPSGSAEATPLGAANGEGSPTQKRGSTTAEQNELRARIEAIGRGEPLDESVQRPLDFARAALERSLASHVVGDTASEARTQKLARAAVELAEARLRLLRERSLYLAARGRHEGASAELAVAQRALERERARARELQRASAMP